MWIIACFFLIIHTKIHILLIISQLMSNNVAPSGVAVNICVTAWHKNLRVTENNVSVTLINFLRRNIRISLLKKQSASCGHDGGEQPVRDVR